MELSRTIFWDTDYGSIDWEKNARYVIARVIMFGTIEDWRQVQSYYGMNRIKEEMVQARDLDPKSLSFLSCILKIPSKNFRCYTQIQSNPGHWVY